MDIRSKEAVLADRNKLILDNLFRWYLFRLLEVSGDDILLTRLFNFAIEAFEEKIGYWLPSTFEFFDIVLHLDHVLSLNLRSDLLVLLNPTDSAISLDLLCNEPNQ